MCAGKRLLGPFETEPAQYVLQLPHQINVFDTVR
jgi:hypothetical protein